MFGGSTLDSYTTTSNISSINATDTSTDYDFGLFDTGISFTRWWVFLSFGILADPSVPGWFQVILFIWQTGFNIVVAGWLISSIWNG